MSAPLTWRAVQVIADYMATIRLADGFRTDLGASVSTDPAQLDGDTDNLPAVHVVTDGDITDAGIDAGRRIKSVPVTAEAYVPVTQTGAHRIAHDLLDDMSRAIPSGKRRASNFPQGVYALDRTGARILLMPEGLPYVVAQLTLAVGVSET